MSATESQLELRDRLVDPDTYTSFMCDWVRQDAKMRKSGQSSCQKWPGELPLIGSELTAFGCTGTVCDYGVHQNKENIYERCVWIKFPGGEFVKALFSEIAVVTPEEMERQKQQDGEFKEKLIAAGKLVERQRKERRARVVKGSHLLEQMLEECSALDVDKKSSFYKVTGSTKGRAIYIAVKGGRVDLSGFGVEHVAITSISEEMAKQKHLGRVRGQIIFALGDDPAMDAFKTALGELNG